MKPAGTLVTLLLLPLLGCTTATMPNGTIYTASTVVAGAGQIPEADWAVYVRDGVIQDVGPRATVLSAYSGAETVDLGNATILPGLTDAHAHLAGLGLSLEIVDLAGTTSYDEVIELVRARAASAGPGEWILGRGWDQNDWAVKEFPTAAALSAAVPDRPVVLNRIDGHAIIANAEAMRLAGIRAGTADPAGGKIIRDARGEPTGVFVDTATDLVERFIPTVTFEQTKRRMLAAATEIASQGLTEIHDAGADDTAIRAVRELVDEKRFPIRLYVMLSDNAALLRDWFARGPLIEHGGRLTVRAVKMYADGALGSRGAALIEPYSDDPGNSGLMISTPDHMADVARRAKAARFQANTHAIGDRGVRNVLEAYERAGITPADRFRIEHLQVIALADVPRLARGGIIASMQPTHATSDMYWAEARVGPERIKGAYAWQTVQNAGGRLALGSDFPVEAVNPWFGIYAAVTRKDQKDWPAGGWRPSERLSLAEAIRGFTLDAAYAAFEENSRGTIERGKLADFTVVEGNPYTMNPDDLYKVRVLRTIVGGESVYTAR